VSENAPATGQLVGLDQDHGAQLSFAIEGEAPAGFTLAADGNWTFDTSHPAYDTLGAGSQQYVQLPFTVTDEHGASYSSFLLILLNGANDGPTLTGTATQLADGNEDIVYVVSQEQLLAGWTDPEQGLTAVNLTVAGATVVANEDGSFSITPAANANGAFYLSYQVTDGLASSWASLNLAIVAVDDPASGIIGDLSGSVMEDAASSVSGNADFTDVDSPSDVWAAVNTPAATANGYGTFTVSTYGVWRYQLNNAHPVVDALQAGQSLVDTFTITTLDGATAQISVTINGHTDYVYVTPAVSTATDPNDFDALHADLARTSTLFSFYGTGASEVLEGSNGNDVMRAQGGADIVYGHNGNDSLYGELEMSNNPPALGEPGGDTLYGQAGNDTLSGGLGSDILYGGSGTDTLHGNNSLGTNAEAVGNMLYGGSGNDRLYGDAGNDVLVGGTGADWLTGRGGSDRFVFTSAADTGDWIFDFQRGVDVLDLSALGLDASGFVGQISSAGMVGPGQVGFMTVIGGSQLDTVAYIDTDGVFGADLEIRLIGTSGLGAADIVWA
jgi:VCBS repeat-containing protein